MNIAACANGLSRSAIEKATAHLKEREQFGKKLADFQGLQFMLADLAIQFEAAQLLVWQAAREFDSGASISEIARTSSIAKCFATDAAMRVTTDAVQLLGGAGYIKEYDVERYMRDAKMLQIVEGTNQIQRVVVARRQPHQGAREQQLAPFAGAELGARVGDTLDGRYRVTAVSRARIDLIYLPLNEPQSLVTGATP